MVTCLALLTSTYISSTSACGILGWDPLGICLRDQSLAQLPDDKNKRCTNDVSDFFTDQAFKDTYSDFTATAMEL